MYDVKSDSSDSQAQVGRSAGVPGKQTLTSALSTPPMASASTASPTPPEVLARVGAEFLHTEDTSAARRYRIVAGGGFLLISSSDGTPGGKLEFRADNEFKKAWSTLCAYVVKNQATIPVTAPVPVAPEPAAPVPADDLWSLVGMTRAIGDGLAAVGDAVAGAVDDVLATIGGGMQAIEDAIQSFFGAAPAEPGPEVTPAEPAHEQPDDGPTPAPGDGPSPAPGETPPKSAKDTPVMSQFRWYDTSFQALGVDDVLVAAKAIAECFKFGGDVTKVTEPSSDVKKKNGNHGFWWFDASGQPTWDGTHGTQYVTFTIQSGETSSKLNPVAAYLAEPGTRPAQMLFGGETIDVPSDVRSLNLRNIPGPASCLATSKAMLAQRGMHDVGGDITQGILTISDEKYRDYTEEETAAFTLDPTKKARIKREVVSVTPDAAAAAKGKAYIDFELDHGRPVLTGITYKEANQNNDDRTDHWIVITGRAGGGYACNDPGDGSSNKQLVWDGEKLHLPTPDPKHPTYLYVVSWIRPNVESLEAWGEHWAQRQSGGGDEAATSG